MRLTISFKLAILVGVLSFLISFGIGTYANNISKQYLEKESGESLLKLSKQVADILDREMLERYREIKFASTSRILWDDSISKEEKRDFIQKIRDNYNHHEWIGYALPDGTVYVGSNGYLEGKNVKARPWLPAGLKGPYIGDVHDALLLAKLLPNTSGEAIYFSDVAFPVKDKNGKVKGVLCTHLMWQWTRDVVRSIERENDVDIYLLSKDGMVLVGPNNTERKQIEDISKNAATAFSSNKTGFEILDWEMGEHYLVAHTVSNGFEEYKGFGWKVMVRKPLDKAFKDLKESQSNIFYASLLIGLIGAIVGIFFASFITNPLSKLSEKIEEIVKKKKDTFERMESDDEISKLNNNFKTLFDLQKEESKLKDMANKKVNMALKVFEQSEEAVLITDNENKIILVNKAFTDITGYAPEDVYGKNPSILSSKEMGKEFYEKMWYEINTHGKWSGKVKNKKKDTSLYDEELKITTIKENGMVVNYIATFSSKKESNV